MPSDAQIRLLKAPTNRCRMLLMRYCANVARCSAGMLRLQYGRDSIQTTDLRARSAREFPGVPPRHVTNASAFERLLVASLGVELQVSVHEGLFYIEFVSAQGTAPEAACRC